MPNSYVNYLISKNFINKDEIYKINQFIKNRPNMNINSLSRNLDLLHNLYLQDSINAKLAGF